MPEQIAATGRTDVAIAPAFGPAPLLVAAAADRLSAAGLRDGDAVVLAVAGVGNPARRPTRRRRLGRVLRRPVALAMIAVGGPRVADTVAALRAGGAGCVAVACWLLAPGCSSAR